MRSVELMIELHQEIIRVVRAGNISLPAIPGDVRRRNKIVDYFYGDGIQTIGTDDISYAIANESHAGCRVDRFGAGGREITGAFKCGRNDSPV